MYIPALIRKKEETFPFLLKNKTNDDPLLSILPHPRRQV